MINILTIENTEDWDKCVKKIDNYDVFYLSGYLKAFQLQGSGEPLLIVYSDGEDYAVNAVFKRDIAEDKNFKGNLEKNRYFDLISPYGYGGFIGNVEKQTKLMKEWNDFCRANRFISEFVRFNLFTEYKDYYTGCVESHTHNVVRDLTMELDDMWMDFKPKVRKNVKKARNQGLEIILDDKGKYLDDFLRIYYGTMERTDAEEDFFFSKEFFNTLLTMKENVMLFHVFYKGIVISTELVLYGSENCYSYLGGTDKNYFNVRPNDFLKYEIIKWAQNKGLKNFVLGGGYGADDGIFQYKATFAPHGIKDFFIGKKIFDKYMYKKLCIIANVKYDDASTADGFFPQYRK